VRQRPTARLCASERGHPAVGVAVVVPAHAQDWQRVWLVGTSLGGFGALWQQWLRRGLLNAPLHTG